MLWQKICQSSHAISVHYSVCEDSEVSPAELLSNYIRLDLTHVYYCREPSSCMVVGSNKSYHSMKQSIILHGNFDKPFAIAIHTCVHFKGIRFVSILLSTTFIYEFITFIFPFFLRITNSMAKLIETQQSKYVLQDMYISTKSYDNRPF